jgi:general secretion pathway protein G
MHKSNSKMRSRHFQKHQSQGGFTLIEVMLVIVIMAILASLIVMNTDGIDHRKVMQSRELLALDLQRIRLESVDQGRVLGLVFLPATDVAPAAYQVVEYTENQTDQGTQPLGATTVTTTYRWQAATDFQTKTLPDNTSLQIQPMDHGYNLEVLNTRQGQIPQLIWLGNGEVLPVRIQLYFQQQPVGEAIELNHLGLVVDQSGAS